MAENKSLQNFDWDAYEKESKGTLNEELIQKYDNTLSAIKDKEVVEGVVMSINKREVVVNVGFKSDGIVPATEFRYNPDLKVAVGSSIGADDSHIRFYLRMSGRYGNL